MQWSELITMLQSKIGETMSNSSFYSEQDARRDISMRQVEISERVKCLDSYIEIDTSPVISGDTSNQISDLTIKGVTIENSDNNNLYWSLSSSGGTISLSLYNDYAKSNLVAQSAITSVSVSGATIAEKNSSGITGTATIAFSGADVDSGNTILSTEEYDLPVDIIEITEARWATNDRPLDILGKRPIQSVTQYGTPRALYFVDPYKVSLSPPTSSNGKLKIWYKKKANDYAFKIKRSSAYGSNKIASVTLVTTPTQLTLHAHYSVGSTSKTISYSTYNTTTKVVDQLNTLVSCGITARISPDIRGDFPSTKIEILDDFSVSTNFDHVYHNVEIPNYMGGVLLEGAVESFREKDREYSNASKHQSKYEGYLALWARRWRAKANGLGYSGIQNNYTGTGSKGSDDKTVFDYTTVS